MRRCLRFHCHLSPKLLRQQQLLLPQLHLRRKLRLLGLQLLLLLLHFHPWFQPLLRQLLLLQFHFHLHSQLLLPQLLLQPLHHLGSKRKGTPDSCLHSSRREHCFLQGDQLDVIFVSRPANERLCGN